jgi:F-type H+-transporting ATPase subunit epsilon
MRLQLVTPDRQLLDTEIDEVYAPGVEGQFGVLPLHVNFLTALDIGELRYRSDGRDHWVAVRGGVAEVLNDVVTILADDAEASPEVNVEDAKADEQSAASALTQAEVGTVEAEDLTAEIAWARTRQVVAARGA